MAVFKGTALRYDIKDLIDETPMDLIEYQASKILPEILVKEKSGLIPVLSTGTGMKQLELKRAPRSTFQRATWVWGNKSYSAYEYGYEEPVDNVEKIEFSDIFNEEVIAGNNARSQLFLAREKRAADAVLDPIVFAAAADKLTVTEEWDDATNAVPYTNITAAHDKLFAKTGIPRARCRLLINEVIFRNVMKADKIALNIKYTQPIDTLPEEAAKKLLAQYLGIAGVDVATSFADSTAIGIEDAVFARLWSSEYAMFYFPCPNTSSWRVKGLGRQPVYQKFSPDYIIESYLEPQTDSTIIRAREYRGVFINKTFGVLMDNMTT